MKTNKINFTLKDYESGKYKVVTRDGRRVRIVCTDLKGNYSIIAIIRKSNGEEVFTSFNTNGIRFGGYISNEDLFLKEVVFDDGDIVSFADGYAIGIFKEINNIRHSDYITLVEDRMQYDDYGGWVNTNMRLATNEERKRLFDALKADGKHWNAEKKCVEDIKEEYQFKPFDKVLVRDCERDLWEISFFGNYSKRPEYRYKCMNSFYRECIPFYGNEELLGTTNKPK